MVFTSIHCGIVMLVNIIGLEQSEVMPAQTEATKPFMQESCHFGDEKFKKEKYKDIPNR